MAFINWVKEPVNQLMVVSLLLALSEALAFIPWVKSNSICQMVIGWIKKAKEMLAPKVQQ